MTTNISKHAIALSDKEFTLLETVHKIGPCNSDQLQEILRDPDLLSIMRVLHDLTARGFLVRPEVDEQLLYAVKSNYPEIRHRIIVMEMI